MATKSFKISPFLGAMMNWIARFWWLWVALLVALWALVFVNYMGIQKKPPLKASDFMVDPATRALPAVPPITPPSAASATPQSTPLHTAKPEPAPEPAFEVEVPEESPAKAKLDLLSEYIESQRISSDELKWQDANGFKVMDLKGQYQHVIGATVDENGHLHYQEQQILPLPAESTE